MKYIFTLGIVLLTSGCQVLESLLTDPNTPETLTGIGETAELVAPIITITFPQLAIGLVCVSIGLAAASKIVKKIQEK